MKSRLMRGSLLVAVALAVGCALPKAHNLPPAQQLMEPGPGVGGPGPGVLSPIVPPPPQAALTPATAQVLFTQPDGMQIYWDVTGVGMFDSEPLVVPGRYNFPQGGIYRLKLTNIPGRPAEELYPTLEIAASTPRTEAFLAHNAIPVEFTEEDFDQVLAGNFVTKVVYLPDAQYQEQALVGVGTLVSTRLDPGQDPIVEADRRGAIMAVIRMGNKDLEAAGGRPGEGAVAPAQYVTGGPAPVAGQPPMLPGYVAGVTAPQWGMPISGTPIGLPGPPHVPLGVPAGLQRHVMRNHTPVHMPGPTRRIAIDVRQNPGYSYPKPPSHVLIREQNIYPAPMFEQPVSDMRQQVH